MNFTESPLFLRLLERTPFSRTELALLILTAPLRYKHHTIEKRHGRGKRLISQPTKEVKYLQRHLVDLEFADLPISDSATGYRKGLSILNHAEPHAAARYLLKMDFKDFFPTLRASAIAHRMSIDTGFSEQELQVLCNILCRKDKEDGALKLSIGAPSSPFMSNYLLWDFDRQLSAGCSELGVTYTRYADDLAFSCNEPKVLDLVRSLVDECIASHDYLKLAVNEAKTVNVSKKNRRTLVGLVLANSGKVSVGRDEKRRLRAVVHRYSLGELAPEAASAVAGKLAFLFSIDPQFVLELCANYNIPNIAAIGRSAQS